MRSSDEKLRLLVAKMLEHFANFNDLQNKYPKDPAQTYAHFMKLTHCLKRISDHCEMHHPDDHDWKIQWFKERPWLWQMQQNK